MYNTHAAPKKNKFGDIVFFGNSNTMVLDKLCAFLLVLSPILQHYVGPYRSAGFSILLILSPYLLLKVLKKIQLGKINTTHLSSFLVLFLFQFYKMISHNINTSKIMYGVFMLICFFTIVCECVNIKYVLRYATYIATFAGLCLILQYILYYIGGFHLQMVPTNLLLPENSAWILGAQTGTASITGKLIDFYRPSAFFLEPSHLMLFCFPVLAVLLLNPHMDKWRMRCAVIITLGIGLSTSGMGIAVCVGIWAVYFFLYRQNKGEFQTGTFKKLFSVKTIAILVLLVAFLILAYTQIGFFRNAVDRIFTAEDGSTSAIDGRVRLARMLVENLSGKNLFFGITDDISDIDFNLSGFFATLYKFGLIGIVLSYFFYVRSFLKLKGCYFWISLIIIIISYFTAHTHGTFYMLYFIIFLMDGYHPKHDPKKQAFKKKKKGLTRSVPSAVR